jgi:uncharacterized protein Usg
MCKYYIFAYYLQRGNLMATTTVAISKWPSTINLDKGRALDWQQSSRYAAKILVLLIYLLHAEIMMGAATRDCGMPNRCNGLEGHPMFDLAHQLDNYRLTTAEIVYRLPDHPVLLQTFVWQALDMAPEFPILQKFLAFWEHNIEGKLYAVRVANCRVIRPAEFRMPACVLTIQ